jgi:hypothetical protein
MVDGSSWEYVSGNPGTPVDVAHCANGIAYYVDTTGNKQLVHNTNVNAANAFRGDGWTTMATPEVPALVTCGARGRLMFLSAAGSVFYRNGISYGQPTGTNFVKVVMTEAHQSNVVTVSVSELSGDAWLLYEDGQVQYIDQTNDNVDLSDDLGTGYTFVDVGMTQLKQLDAGNNEVFGVNHWNEVFRRAGITQ